MAENGAIFFRDQHITPEQHLDFGRRFGELHIHPAAPHEPGHPALMVIKADENSTRANGEGWHSDVSCDEEPPMGSILYIKECPPAGGDTLFASMYAAYDALSDRMKAYLDGMTALHEGEHVYRGLYAEHRRRGQAELPEGGAPGGADPSGDGPEGALREPRLHRATCSACRATRATACCDTSTSTWRTRSSSAASAGGELDRVLGQPLRPAPGDVGLLAAPPLRQPGDGEGRAAGLTAVARPSPRRRSDREMAE